MTDNSPFSDAVSAEIKATLGRNRFQLNEISEDSLELQNATEDILENGKRLRSRLSYWGWRAANWHSEPTRDFSGEAADKPIVALGAALEIFHTALLVHDDIIDNSDSRRGKPSAHRRFATLHADRQWEGIDKDFGTASAILLGDILLSLADDGFLDCAMNLTGESQSNFRRELRNMRTSVSVGQYLDLLDGNAWRAIPISESLERAKKVAVYKTAKYSVEHPLVLGAILGSAPAETVSALRAFALPLGFAFQLRDDLLGVFGDENQTGKPSGGDLIEGKRTVLLAIARSQADKSTLAVLDDLIGDPDLGEDQIQMLRATLLEIGAVNAVEDLIEKSRQRALAVLAEMGLDGTIESALMTLTNAISRRSV